jgi:hypothetical protein
MRALVVNCSAPHYNLGAKKCADWLRALGYAVSEWAGDPGMFSISFDLVALSVVFSWHARIALAITTRVRDHAQVWCGGPGMAALGSWWRRETGLDATLGVDARFERQRGHYRMTFASRGCPVGCWFCIVPKIEGKNFTLDWDFVPAPILCDNNLSALPVDFQEHVLKRYRECSVRLADANSGFEPHTFDEGTLERWGATIRLWRFAFDEQREAADVERMMKLLTRLPARRKQVYCLMGNEPIAECLDRAQSIIAWGGEPYCQYVRPLNWLGDPARQHHRHDWTEQVGRDICRYFNRHLWRSLPLYDYKPRANEPPPFRGIVATA